MFQQYVKVLGARIISYLNIDVAVEGTICVRNSNDFFAHVPNRKLYA